MLKRQINQAIAKQAELFKDNSWRNILLPVPPVLWFGDMNSEKPKIVTIGANPSNLEFCDRKGNLLDDNNKRFEYNIPYEAKNLETAYNNYFNFHPYKIWFGTNNSKVEAFLNGLNASYYNEPQNSYEYQAIHIDFFPFATLKKFTDKSVLPLVESSLFKTYWTNNSISTLLSLIKPKLVVVFGRTNVQYFSQCVPDVEKKYKITDWQQWKRGKLSAEYKIRIPKNYTDPQIIMLSTYLGNPKGFKAQDLQALSQHIQFNMIH